MRFSWRGVSRPREPRWRNAAPKPRSVGQERIGGPREERELTRPFGGAPRVDVAVDGSVDISVCGTKWAVPICKMAGPKLDSQPLATQKTQLS
ncbi:MAG: hypothetical protein AB7U61_01220 [Methylocystis sp.]